MALAAAAGADGVDWPARGASARDPRSCPRSPRAPGARPWDRRTSGGPGTGVPRPDAAGSTSQRSSRRSSIVALIPAVIGRSGLFVERPPLVQRVPTAKASGRGEGEGEGARRRAPRPHGATPGGRRFPTCGERSRTEPLVSVSYRNDYCEVRPPPVKGKARKMDISKLTHGAKLVLGAHDPVPDRLDLQLAGGRRRRSARWA